MAIRLINGTKNKWVCSACGEPYDAAAERGRKCGSQASYGGEDGPPAFGFETFKKNNAAREIFGRLDVLELLDDAGSWEDLRFLVVRYNDRQTDCAFVRRARELDGVASSGERVLLHAILSATDFAWLADEMDTAPNHDCWVWRRFDVLSGSWRHALMCCIAQQD
jgi:hypothetical protein